MMFGNGWNGIGSCFGFGNGLMYGGLDIIIMLGITAIIVAGIVILARKTAHAHTNNIALETLKMKLAKGEITDAEYLRRKISLD